MQTPANNRSSMELDAAGNTVLEGKSEKGDKFVARALRMTYDQAKDLLVLEGDGRTDAELFRQQQVGGPMSKATARKIHFWPSTNRLRVDGAHSLELSQFSRGDKP